MCFSQGSRRVRKKTEFPVSAKQSVNNSLDIIPNFFFVPESAALQIATVFLVFCVTFSRE
jgi:hypothetical protein